MKQSLKNILMLFDFSEPSLNAAKTAIAMSRRHGATLHLLFTQHAGHTMLSGGMQVSVVSLLDELHDSNARNLESFAASVREHQAIDCRTHIMYDSSPQAVCEMEKALNADLIVIGANTSNKTVLDNLFGSTSYSLIKHTHCPVLTVPEGKRTTRFKSILFPVRQGSNALEKYQFIKPIIARNKASVHVVGALSHTDAKNINSVKSRVERLLRMLSENDTAHTYQYHVNKNIAGNIIAEAEKISADLIVITASAKRNLKQFLFSNFTQKMMNNNKTAVLSVKSDSGNFLNMLPATSLL